MKTANNTVPVLFLLALFLLGPLTSYAQTTYPFDLPEQQLAESLRAVGHQTNTNVMFEPRLVKGLAAPALRTQTTTTEAIRLLLAGTKLTVLQTAADTILIQSSASDEKSKPARQAISPTSATSGTNGYTRLAQAESAPSQSSSSQGPLADEKRAISPKKVVELEKILVTGTRIKGAQPSSPVVTITHEEMRMAGHSNLGEVFRALPQNFSGGQNPGVLTGVGGLANQNITGASSLNLRGLGPDATLTLFNGARLPYDGFSQATDVAVIPVAAIDRVEVLLDGASALYGSDAVGGVANIVLKRDYDGTELSARYGEATDGGYEQTQVTAIVGESWESGGLLVAGEATSSSAVLAEQRDYLDYISHPDLLTVYPKTSQDGVLLSGHQKLGSLAELALDAFYTKRSIETRILTTSFVRNETASSINGLSPSFRVSLPGDWSLRLHGFVGEDEARTHQRVFSLATGIQTSEARVAYRNRAKAGGVEFEGAVFALPGGDARLSFGGGWRKTEFEQENPVTGIAAIARKSNSSQYAYGEINLPLVGESHEIPFVKRLSLNGAARYENYDSFGDTTTPKIGVVWNVSDELDVRASWGKSFKAPTLTQQYQAVEAILLNAAAFSIPDVPGNATAFFTLGGTPDLRPERAEVVTAGFTLRPTFLPGSTFEVGWFKIDYTQRVINPFQFPTTGQFGQTLNDPAYADFVVINPTAGEQSDHISSGVLRNFSGATYDPETVVAIFDNRFVNASSQVARGVDLDIRYAASAFGGTLSLNAAGSWITDSQRKLMELAPGFPTAGVVGFPVKFRGRFGADWSQERFSLAATLNHLGGVSDTNSTPNRQGDSMTTLDLVLDYAAKPGAVNGIGFTVAMTNVFNQRPPFLNPIQPYYVNYDSTNYSALGRVVSVSITKQF